MQRVGLAVLTAMLLAGCGGTSRTRLAIYDWEAQRATPAAEHAHALRCATTACPAPAAKRVYVQGDPKLTDDDLERESVRAGFDRQVGAPIVTARLTPEGQKRFAALSRTLARRGSRMRRPQHFLIAVDDVVRTSPSIDYHQYPNGIAADTGIQISGLTSLHEAKKLAEALRAR